MKHLAVTFLFSLALFAQEAGVPYLNSEKVNASVSLKRLYFKNTDGLIFYRDRQGYAIKRMATNQEIFRIKLNAKWFECSANTNLSQVVCKSGDAYDGKTKVDYYEVGKKNPQTVLKSDHVIHEMVFSKDGSRLYINTEGNSAFHNGHLRTAGSITVFDTKSKKIVTTITTLSSGKIFVGGSILLQTDGSKYDDLETNPVHSIFHAATGEKTRSFELRGKNIHELSDDGKLIYATDKNGTLFTVNTIDGLAKRVLNIHTKYCALKNLNQDHLLLFDYRTNDIKVISLKDEMIQPVSLKKHPNSSFSLDDIGADRENSIIFYRGEIWDIDADRLLLTMHAIDNTWLAITPDGHFDGSENSRQYLYMKTSTGKYVPIDDETYKKYHSPQIVNNLVNQTIPSDIRK